MLLSSALLWSCLGLFLLGRGLYRLTSLQDMQLTVLLTALIGGTLKSKFILDPAARRGIHRLCEFQDGTCLGAIYSPLTWLLVLTMAAAGIFLRNSALPSSLVSLLTLAVGWGLTCSSRLAWFAWYRLAKKESKGP